MKAVLADPATAPIPPEMRATLRVLEAMTLDPARLVAEVRAARDAGLSRDAVESAMYVCAMFNVMDRMADALGFDPATASPPELFLKFGYAGMLRRVQARPTG